MADGYTAFLPFYYHRKAGVAMHEPIATEELEHAAFVQREIERRITAPFDDEPGVAEMSSAFGGRRWRWALRVPMLPRKEVTPSVVAEDMVIRITRREPAFETGGEAI